jgi:hypothetical protein
MSSVPAPDPMSFFEGKASIIRAIAMIRGLLRSLITLATQKLRQFYLHHFTEVFAYALTNIVAYQIEELLGLRLNLFEQADDYGYASFDLHGRFSSIRD